MARRPRRIEGQPWTPDKLARLSDERFKALLAQSVADRSDLNLQRVTITNRVKRGASAGDLRLMLAEVRRRQMPLAEVSEVFAADAFAGQSFVSNLVAPPTWRRFEIHAAEAIVQFLQHHGVRLDRIEFDALLPGRSSGSERQVDLLLVRDAPRHVVACEFKDHGRRIDVETIEAFAGKLPDIGADRGAFVSRAGYQRGAVGVATSSKIDLFTLREIPREEAVKIVDGLPDAPTYWLFEGPGGIRGVSPGSVTGDPPGGASDPPPPQEPREGT